MKKLLALLLCAALLPILPAMAEDTVGVPLFRLTRVDAYGQEIHVGSAILMSDQVLLTAVPGMNSGDMAYSPGGNAYSVAVVVQIGGGLSLLQLDRVADTQPAQLTAFGSGSLRLSGVMANGQRYYGEARNIATAEYNHMDALLLTADAPLLPGAVLTNVDGETCGMVAAEWGEGELRYVALSGKALMEIVMAAAVQDSPDEQASSDGWLQEISASYADGTLTLDWSAAGVESAEGFTVYCQDINTVYYYYYQVAGDQFSIELPLVPGRNYAYWVKPGGHEGADGLTWRNAKEYYVPDGEMYTEHGFTSESYLAAYPADQVPDAMEELPPLEEITADALTDSSQRLYLQVINTYTVEEEIETSMIGSLHTPDGQVFYDINGYIFMPDFQEHDAWNIDVTGLFEEYLAYGPGDFGPGVYELRYTIGGDWGGIFTFTLE